VGFNRGGIGKERFATLPILRKVLKTDFGKGPTVGRKKVFSLVGQFGRRRWRREKRKTKESGDEACYIGWKIYPRP
jgi:hypothetical protein